jgi:hypothetical protein
LRAFIQRVDRRDDARRVAARSAPGAPHRPASAQPDDAPATCEPAQRHPAP